MALGTTDMIVSFLYRKFKLLYSIDTKIALIV